jgi:phosphopantetheinyl transferase (holo-ACP synthase)
MLLGIGIDILSIPRITALLNRRPNAPRGLARRICSPRELCEFDELISKDQDVKGVTEDKEGKRQVSSKVVRFLSAR